MIPLVRILHIAGGVVLIGELFFAGRWLAKALRAGDAGLRDYVITTMEWTSKSYALPAIAVNFIAGVALIFIQRTPVRYALWLWIAIALYAVVMNLWHGVLIPLRKKMAAVVGDAGGRAGAGVGAGAGAGMGAGAGDFDSMARTWLRVNVVTLTLLFAILALMIWRPMI